MTTKTAIQTDDFDFSIADGTNQDYIDVYPRIQWQHGSRQLSKLGDVVAHTGGIFLPADQFPNFSAEGWAEDSFISSQNEEIKGYSTTKAFLAVLRVKTWWSEYDDGKKSSATHLLCCIKGVDGIFSLQVGGISKGQPMLSAFTAHRNQIVAMVNRTKPAGTHGFEPYAMWFAVEPGPHETQSSKKDATKGSEVTKPRLYLPETVDLAYARTLWVGADNYKAFSQLYKDTESWQTQFPKGKAHEDITDTPGFSGNGNGPTPQQVDRLGALIELKKLDKADVDEYASLASSGATTDAGALTKDEFNSMLETIGAL